MRSMTETLRFLFLTTAALVLSVLEDQLLGDTEVKGSRQGSIVFWLAALAITRGPEPEQIRCVCVCECVHDGRIHFQSIKLPHE